MRVGELGGVLEGLPGTGRRLGVDQRNQLRPARVAQRGLDLLGADDATPRGLDPMHDGTRPLRDLGHPRAEDAVHADHDLVAGLDGVDEARLHPGAAGAGDRQRQRVRGREDEAQHRLLLVHHRDERRIEVADQRGGHRPQHPRMHLGRTGTQQHAGRRRKLSGQRRHGGAFIHDETPIGQTSWAHSSGIVSA